MGFFFVVDFGELGLVRGFIGFEVFLFDLGFFLLGFIFFRFIFWGEGFGGFFWYFIWIWFFCPVLECLGLGVWIFGGIMLFSFILFIVILRFCLFGGSFMWFFLWLFLFGLEGAAFVYSGLGFCLFVRVFCGGLVPLLATDCYFCCMVFKAL